MDSPNTPNSTPQEDFKFDDPRQLAIYNYLKGLVSDGAASFYKDACRHMAAKPPFDTTTHTVAHLLREIESALRDVLETIAEPVAAPQKDFSKTIEGVTKTLREKSGMEITDDVKEEIRKELQNINDANLNNLEDNKATHLNEIVVILKALGIQDTDPLAKAWLELPGASGLQRMAHRDNLNNPRPIDDEFREMWENFNSILFGVLDKVEAQYTKFFNNLDTLAQKTNPTKADVKILKLHIPQNRISLDHFFTQISSPKWLPLLESSEFFKLPPSPEKDIENNGIRHPNWPILSYLSKMASELPDLVAKILSEIPDSENGNVKAGMLVAATNLPKEKKIELIPHIKKWINSEGQFFSSIKSVDFIKSLVSDNEMKAALELSRELLDILPPVGRETYSFREPRTAIDQWQYARFLENDFPAISQQDPLEALKLLCELLAKYTDLDRAGKSENPPEDYSYIRRPAIETSEHYDRDDADNSLIDAIISVSIEAIDKNPELLEKIIQELRKQKWQVFHRIAFYLLSKYPTIKPELSIEVLQNTDLIDDSNFNHEYALLAKTGFHLLAPEQKDKIFKFIDKAEARTERVKQVKKEVTQTQAENMVKMWQRDKLSIFDSDLEGEKKEWYEKLIKDLGDPSNPRVRERSKVWVGPESHVTADKLNQMTPDEVVELLKKWKQPENKHGFGPSKEGLGRELNNAVKKDPALFSTFAMKFAGLDPTYVRNYIQGFSEIVQNHVPFEWEQIIELALWIIEQPREIPGRKEEDVWGDEDPHWGWTRRSVVSLISSGLNNNVIAFSLHEKVWKIIETLSSDPNPTPEEELTKEGTLRENAYDLTINTVRGEAMTAVVEYGLWLTRIVDQLPEDKRPKEKGFDLMPHVKDVLEKHLSDPSIAVHAVYGRYLPWILLLGREWTISHLKEIFPSGKFNTPLYDAAWDTYLGYVSAYNDVFEVLQDEYLEAVKNIGAKEKSKDKHLDKDTKLAEHLMVFFWRGKLNFKDKNNLLATFWKVANDDVRAHAIGFIGRSLQSDKDPLEPEVAKLLKELWEVRIEEVETSPNKEIYRKEMGAFGWWFASGKLDEDWSIKEFLRSLEISKKVDGDYQVMDRLVKLADTRPVETAQILSKLIQRDRPQWLLFGNESDLRNIFGKLLSSSESSAKVIAEELINRLVAWGYTGYSDLLPPPAPPDPVQ